MTARSYCDETLPNSRRQTVVPLEFPMFSIEKPIEKETAGILKRIDQLPQNLARLHNLVGSFDRSHKNSDFSIVSIIFYCFSIVHLLF